MTGPGRRRGAGLRGWRSGCGADAAGRRRPGAGRQRTDSHRHVVAVGFGGRRRPGAGRQRTRRRIVRAAAAGGLLAGLAVGLAAQGGLAEAIAALGDFEYDVRTEAAQRLRRAEPAAAAPALIEAARGHADSYVQFRAAVLLAGFGGPGARAFFREAIDAPNDRVRAAAYAAAEYDPDPAFAPALVAAAGRETSEFVRPALMRALAAHDDDPAARALLVRDIDRGEGMFRAVVIEALGDYGAAYAVEPLIRIAAQAGPLRDDALLALGRIGDRRAGAVVAAARAEADAALQPIVAAAACLLGVDCPAQWRYIAGVLDYGAAAGAGADPDLVRRAATAAGALAMAGQDGALAHLFDRGVAAVDPVRAPIALAVGAAALRAPALVIDALAGRDDLDAVLLLLRDAFDMLDEDVAEERVYLRLRDAYWTAAPTSRARAAAEAAMQVLEF